jgi:hypothetical protein
MLSTHLRLTHAPRRKTPNAQSTLQGKVTGCRRREIMKNKTPKWNADGEPVNFEAAAIDAHEWLLFLKFYMQEKFNSAITEQELPRLQGCIDALEKFLTKENPPAP